MVQWAPHQHERVAGCDNFKKGVSGVSSVRLLPEVCERPLTSQEKQSRNAEAAATTSVAGRPHQQFMVRRRQVSIEKLMTKKLIQREAAQSVHTDNEDALLVVSQQPQSRNHQSQPMIGTMPMKPRMPALKRAISNHDYASAEPATLLQQRSSASTLQSYASVDHHNFKHTLLRHQLRRQRQQQLPPAAPSQDKASSSAKKGPKLAPSAKSTLELFRNSVNASRVEADQHETTLGTVQREAERKNQAYLERQSQLEVMRLASEEIARKRLLVSDLRAKYPDCKLDADYVVKCSAEEVSRLVQLLMFDEKLSKAALRIQSHYRMRRCRREFLR